jgi:hypothetical protein
VKRALLIVLTLFGLGCAASADPDPDPDPEDAVLELGTGTARFELVADGDEVPMIRGAQGGWHVWVSVRIEGMDVDLASLTLEHQPADESEPAQITSSGAMFDPADSEGRRSSLGWAAIFSDPSCSVGRLHRIRATVTTATGERISIEREIIPSAGTFPPPACGATE